MAIKDAVNHKQSKELLKILQKCRTIVGFFHRSPAATNKLKAEQLVSYPTRTPLKLIGDVETRWNSQYDMLARLLQLRKALTTVMGGEGMRNTINSCEWSMIHEYCTTLRLFKDATHVLTTEDAPTLSRCIPAIYGMKETLMAIIAKDNTPNTLQFTKNLLIEINRRLDFIENSKTLILAMLLDPRVKDRLLSAEKKREALVILELVASNYMVQVTEISTESTEIQEISGVYKTIRRLCDILSSVVR